MANYEKQVEQEAAYPIPLSLYNCTPGRNIFRLGCSPMSQLCVARKSSLYFKTRGPGTRSKRRVLPIVGHRARFRHMPVY